MSSWLHDSDASCPGVETGRRDWSYTQALINQSVILAARDDGWYDSMTLTIRICKFTTCVTGGTVHICTYLYIFVHICTYFSTYLAAIPKFRKTSDQNPVVWLALLLGSLFVPGTCTIHETWLGIRVLIILSAYCTLYSCHTITIHMIRLYLGLFHSRLFIQSSVFSARCCIINSCSAVNFQRSQLTSTALFCVLVVYFRCCLDADMGRRAWCGGRWNSYPTEYEGLNVLINYHLVIT